MKYSNRLRLAIAISLVAVTLTPGICFAAKEKLDPTSGLSGKAVTALGATGDIYNAVAIQTDGKTFAVGQMRNGTHVNLLTAAKDSIL